MAKAPKAAGVGRIAPVDAPSDAVERIAHRRATQLEDGDMVICREQVPRLRSVAGSSPRWRYRVYMHPDEPHGRVFNSFPHAASEAEHLASTRKGRVMYVEDAIPMMLANYRPRSA